jgi:putative SOS response-associated peptidase YedK
MCGRVVLSDPADVVARLLGLEEVPAPWPLRSNVAPTSLVPAVREPGRLELLRWGMKMSNPRAGGFNARRESMRLYDTDKRCLVVVSGFYEWRRLGGSKKQPHLVRRLDGHPMVFAGLYDASDGVAIVTAPATGVLAELHDRMPVVLERESFDAYLDSSTDIAGFFAAASAESLTMHPVGQSVGNARVDDPSLIVPVPDVATGEPSPRKQLPLF